LFYVTPIFDLDNISEDVVTILENWYTFLTANDNLMDIVEAA